MVSALEPVMAIVPPMMNLIRKANGKGKAISAGYPDLLLSPAVANQCIGNAIVPYRPDSKEIMARHSVKLDGIYDSHAFFKAMGYDLEVMDFREVRGGEIIVDLNYPVPCVEGRYGSQYDLVIDPGTCEHCFHIGTAIVNLSRMVKPGGHIVQGFPLNAYNHGFYSVSPTLVRDFYEDNGFEIVECFGLVNSSYYRFEVSFTKRFHSIPENSFMLILAKRLEEKELTIPVQHKYRVMM